MKTELVLANLKREKEALDAKCEKIQVLLEDEEKCNEVGELQEELLDQQLNAMSLYSFILEQRIADLEFKVELKKHIEEKNMEEEKGEDDFDACIDELLSELKKTFEDCDKDVNGFRIEIKNWFRYSTTHLFF